MPFQLNCPGCQHQFTVPDSFADKRGKCPKCNAVFRAVRPPEMSAAGQSNGAKPGGKPRSLPRVPTSPAPGRVGKTPTAKSSTGPRIPRPKKLEAMLPPEEAQPDAPAAPPKPRKSAKPPAAAKAKSAAPPQSPDPLGVDTLAAPLASNSKAVSLPTTKADSKSPRRAAPTPPSSPLRLVIGIGLLLIAGVALAAVLGKYWLDNRDAIASHLQNANTNVGGTSSNPSSPSTTDDTPDGLDAETDPASAPLHASWDDYRQGIVHIELLTAGGGSRGGTGFIVDRRGWVATSYHLIEGAEDALLVSGDGQRFEVAGIVAVNPEHGIAILQIENVPTRITVLPMDADLLPHPRMLAFAGDTSTATPATVTRMVDTSALPAKAMLHLNRAMRDGEKVDWIEHTARAGLDGDGTPLLSAEGNVIGLNVRLGGEIKNGYAVHAKYLSRLLRDATDDVTPFSDQFAAVTPLPPGPPDVVDLGEPTFPTPPDPVEPEPADGTPRDVADLQFRLAQCEELKWLPKTAEDYAKFQDFALLLHRAAVTVKDESAPEPLRTALQETIDKAIESIEGAVWPTKETMNEVGKLAEELAVGDAPGVFAYCRVALRPDDLPGAEIDGHPVFGFEIAGTTQMLLTPVAEGKDEIFTESVRLIIGERDLATEITISSSDGGDAKPGKLVRAQFILGDPALR